MHLVQLCGCVERELERLGQASDKFCAAETGDYFVLQCLRKFLNIDVADFSRREVDVPVNVFLRHCGRVCANAVCFDQLYVFSFRNPQWLEFTHMDAV